MRICPDCGRELTPGEERCPLCGAEAPDSVLPTLGDTLDELADRAASPPAGPMPEGDTPPATPAFAEGTVSGFDVPLAEEVKPKRKAIVFVPIALACAVVLGLAIWLASGLLQGPDKAFLTAHQTLFRSIAQTELAFLAPNGQEEAANVDMILIAQVDDSLGETAAILNNTTLRVQAEGGKDGGILTAALDLGEDTVLEATVTGNKSGILGFYIPQLSETYYMMDYVRFVENNSDGQFTADDVDEAAEAAEAWERTLKTYGDILVGVVNKENVTKQTGTFTSFYLPTVQYPGTAYVFTPTAEELETMFVQLADALEKDKTLVTLVDGLTDDMLAETVEQIRADGPEEARRIADSGFTWAIRRGKGRYGVNAQIELSWDHGESAIRFDRLSNAMYFGVVENGEESLALSASYYEAEDGTWHGSAGVTGVGGIEWEDVDLDAGSSLGLYHGFYTIVNKEGGRLASMEVAPSAGGGTDHTFRMRLDESDDTLATLNLHTTDQPVSLTFPDAPMENITDYTTEDFEALGESWAEGVSALAMQFILYAYQYQ